MARWRSNWCYRKQLHIVVPKDRRAALAAVNALLDEVRASGFLQSAIERGGAIGVAVAPVGAKAGCPG
jgi:ABC-type amino acid transport substrate-binding protein